MKGVGRKKQRKKGEGKRKGEEAGGGRREEEKVSFETHAVNWTYAVSRQCSNEHAVCMHHVKISFNPLDIYTSVSTALLY